MLLLTMACSIYASVLSGEDDAPIAETAPSTDPEAPETETLPPDEDTAVEEPVVPLSGTLLLEDGTNPEGLVRIFLISDYDIAIFPDSNGDFEVSAIEAGRHALIVEALDGHHASFATVLDLDPEVPLDLGELILPRYTHTSPVVSGDFSAGDGLTITVDEAGFDGLFSSDDDRLASASIAPEDLPMHGVDGEVLGVWLLGAFGATAEPAWPVHIGGGLGLPEGDVVRLVQPRQGAGPGWAEAGTATVTDGDLVSDEGAGIHDLTVLLVVR